MENMHTDVKAERVNAVLKMEIQILPATVIQQTNLIRRYH